VSDVPSGASLSVARTGPGDYLVTIAGLGTGCPLPIANAFYPTTMFLAGGFCGGGSVTTTLETLDGLDHPFAFRAAGNGAAPAARGLGSEPAAASDAARASQWMTLPDSNDRF
jgi:hypothetical protein